MLRVSYDFSQLFRYLFPTAEVFVLPIPRHRRDRLLVISRGFYLVPRHRLLLAEYWLVSEEPMRLRRLIGGPGDNTAPLSLFAQLRGIIHQGGAALVQSTLDLLHASQQRLALMLASPQAEQVQHELTLCHPRLWLLGHRVRLLLRELQ